MVLTIEEKYPGIYYVYGFSFPVQIVVIKQLRSGEHKSLKVLLSKADRDDIKAFLKETEDLCSPREKQNIDAVLQASVRANYELYEVIRRESTMCEALRELMKDEIEKDVNAAKEAAMAEGREIGISQGIEQGIVKGRDSLIDAVLRLRKGETQEQLMDSGVDKDTIELALKIQ